MKPAPSFGNAYVPMIEEGFLTLGVFGEHVFNVTGLRLRDIKADGIRITSAPGSFDSPVWVEITTYCANDKGNRYFDENHEIATEVRRFPLTALTLREGFDAPAEEES